MNENLENVEENSVTEQQQVQGVMKAIYEYIDAMKEAGVYEESMIIITGDHGRHESGNLESNPAVLIKGPLESHGLERNSAPVHFRNVVAAMAGVMEEDYSEYCLSVYEITEDSDVERLHTINESVRRRIVLDEGVEEAWYYRFIISEKAHGEAEYRLWNPSEINRITYHIEDIIMIMRSKLNIAYIERKGEPLPVTS